MRQKRTKTREICFVNLQVGIRSLMGKMMIHLKKIVIANSRFLIQALPKTHLKLNEMKNTNTKN